MGLLTKIFGNADGAAEAVVEQPGGGEPGAEGRAASAPRLGKDGAASRDADPGSSGIRAAVEPTPPLTQDATRSAAANRRPEHPRLYLRPTPIRIDPSVPGSTRRPQIALRPTGKESGAARASSNGAPRERASVKASPPDRPPPPAIHTPPSGTRPAMVVSPVSLTAEEVQLPAGARPKMQTLLGLGMGYGLEVAPDTAVDAQQPQPIPARALNNEPRIVRELLCAIDGLLPMRRRRVEERMTLQQLGRATPELLAAELATPLERARAVGQLVAEYLRERQTRASEADNCQRLIDAVEELARRARELEACDEDRDEEQRMARSRRRDALRRVNVLLAERGELDLLDELEPCAVAARLMRLRAWLNAEAAGQKPLA